MAYHDGYAGGYGKALMRTSGSHGQFFRSPDGHLVAFPVNNGSRSGAHTAESYETASDPFRISGAPITGFTLEDAQTAVVSAWAVNSGAAIATLKTAIHSDLDAAGFLAQDGASLV